MTARLVAAREIPATAAASLSSVLLARAREMGEPSLAGALVNGPAVLLGARQREARVLDPAALERASMPVVRRATTGTHVFIGPGDRAALFVLALPRVSSLMADAKGPTVLNRNVRGWLQGLTRYGASAQYYGREWLSVQRRPFGVLALAGDARGAVVIELWIGRERSLALDPALCTDTERGTDRWLAKSPASWNELCSAHPLDLARIDAINARAFERFACSYSPLDAMLSDGIFSAAEGRPPTPEPPASGRWAAPSPCEIGWIDAAVTDTGQRWVGGDPLLSDDAALDLAAALGAAPSDRSALAGQIADESIALGVSPERWDACGAALDDVVRSTAS